MIAENDLDHWRKVVRENEKVVLSFLDNMFSSSFLRLKPSTLARQRKGSCFIIL